jgi:transposase
MSKGERKNLTAEEKLAIIKEHLVGGLGVPDLCEKHGIKPSAYYAWQNLLFENTAAFERRKSAHNENQKIKRVTAQLEALEQSARQKDEVLAELMCEHLKLKKNTSGGS